MTAPQLSLVVPARDEEECVPALYGRVVEVFGSSLSWELVLVDDGSRDRTAAVIGELSGKDARVRGVVLTRSQGQSTALRVGFEAARAPLIATLDADLQNDPGDLPAMLGALPGHDAVVGYRRVRRDDWLRRWSSRIANAIRNRVTGDRVRDTGCSLKLFRADAVRSLPFFDGMHRFLPTLLRTYGYRVREVPVSHHPRLAGRSKYGVRNRIWRASVDLLGVRWLRSRSRRPEVDRIVESGRDRDGAPDEPAP